MMIPPFPPNEADRLLALRSFSVLDTGPEESYNDLTCIAAAICQTPIALVSLIDEDRQWFKARLGLDVQETSRDLSFCAHAILQQDLFIIKDAQRDNRFADHPAVLGDPYVRFYAGMPLITGDGYALGTLCVVDREPRQLSDTQAAALRALSRQVIYLLEMRLQNMRLAQLNQSRTHLLTVLSHDLKSSFSTLIGYTRALNKRARRMSVDDILNALKRIEDSSERGHQLLLDILDWSRRQIKEKSHILDSMDAVTCCREAMDLVEAIAQAKHVSLSLIAPEKIILHSDQRMLISALQNLLSNAVKFSYPGGQVEIRAEDAESHVNITVTDYGVGMDPARAEKIFQTDDFSSTKGTQGEPGTGLGTLLVKEFVGWSGGSVNVISQLGRGCSVKLVLPKANPSAASAKGCNS